ncbi:TPA: ead/Ea22-like family protein, partial [Klebsiella michiganensis]
MTTDITELAQSLKAAAEKAIAEEGSTWWNEEQLASDYGLALHRTDAKFIALASHENVLALV